MENVFHIQHIFFQTTKSACRGTNRYSSLIQSIHTIYQNHCYKLLFCKVEIFRINYPNELFIEIFTISCSSTC